MRDTAGTPHFVFDRERLATAEPYGDVLTHPRGHHTVWTQWRRRGSRFLTAQHWPFTILTTEYDDHPRGRVAFDIPTNNFWIYANRPLQHPCFIAAVRTTPALTAEHCLVKSDGHYR